MLSLLLACSLATSEPFNYEWTTTNTAMEVSLLALGIIDVTQTIKFLDMSHTDPEWACEERNPVLGPHPSRRRLWGTFAYSIAVHAIVAAALPHPYRDVWQGVVLGIESANVATNAYFVGGVKLSF